MTWNFLGVVPEGQEFKINGINVWSQKWTMLKDEFAEVKDSTYNREFKFHVYIISQSDIVIKFVAGEFSNSMWGFYIEAEV
ncbi:MAG: hypothetical protein WCA79_00875 [Anaerolineales bacterium]